MFLHIILYIHIYIYIYNIYIYISHSDPPNLPDIKPLNISFFLQKKLRADDETILVGA